jgi:nucleoside-diphosphate-sugar epimerase
LKKICIIGGSGFVGTRLINRLLQRGHEFFISNLDKAMSQAHPGMTKLADVRSLDQLAEVPQGSVLITLAAEHRDDVRPLSLYDDVNVGGAENICAIARKKQVSTIVFTSSVAVYGFAPVGTDESGKIAPFNDYGRTKFEAEKVFRQWQSEEPHHRTLVIVRPTVIFGERNRGNVHNLLRQIASGNFMMIGSGENRKSMAYVENVAAFIEHSMAFGPGIHTYNFIDKPDFTINQLVGSVKRLLGQPEQIGFRLPYAVGYAIGKGFDLVAAVTGRRLAISSIRVKKFCANSVYNTAIDETGFVPPVPLAQALEQTIRHEFIEKHDDVPLYFSE